MRSSRVEFITETFVILILQLGAVIANALHPFRMVTF
jgi:hypothetical protein